jgi:hypothetical protein
MKRSILKTKYFVITDYGNTVPRKLRYEVESYLMEGVVYATTINTAVKAGRRTFNSKTRASYLKMMREYESYAQGVFGYHNPTSRTRDTFRDTELLVSDFIELPANYYG